NYPKGIAQQVLVLQQLDVTPPLEKGGKGATPQGPYFSVNGALQPVITMAPGEVQWWRIANTSSPGGAYFVAPAPGGLSWQQLAQDGVQFNKDNVNSHVNQAVYLAPGNRADLLVQAPATAGSVDVVVYNVVDPVLATPAQIRLTLLTVNVTGTANPMTF